MAKGPQTVSGVRPAPAKIGPEQAEPFPSSSCSAAEGFFTVMHAEISYDLVMGDEMEFVEGSFRLPGGDWQVVIVSRYDVSEPVAVPQFWDSGVRGVLIRFPHGWPLNASAVERVLSSATGHSKCVVVSGPDSMQLR